MTKSVREGIYSNSWRETVPGFKSCSTKLQVLKTDPQDKLISSFLEMISCGFVCSAKRAARREETPSSTQSMIEKLVLSPYYKATAFFTQ